MKTLELKYICGYLPYGLNYLRPDGSTILQAHGTLGTLFQSQENGQITYSSLSGCRPILRPMSDLTKEITRRGERFVPIVELGRIIGPGGNWQVYRDGAGYLIEYGDDDVECVAHLCYSSDCFRLSVGDDIESISTSDTIAFFDRLNEWMFDYRNLISAGLAIDVNTLPENPYE